MHIYLPIAEMSVNILWLTALGCGVGFLSGMLGISGGFLSTPILILMGIPAPVAVASQTAGIIATFATGASLHWRLGHIDWKMLGFVLIGGISGSSFGVWIFSILNHTGDLDFVIRVMFVLLLGGVGFLMFLELSRTSFKLRKATPIKKSKHHRLHYLPFRFRFKKSRLYISCVLPISLGFVIGGISAILGIGGGFMMIPAMIYLLGMHTSVVVGTSIVQSFFVAINSAFWQASVNHTVDIVLTLFILIGGVVGASFGARVSKHLRSIHLRFLLATIITGVSVKLAISLLTTPDAVYTLVPKVGM